MVNYDKKAKRVDRIKNSLDEEELIRRLPEVDAILDDQIRSETIKVFLNGAPPHFWERPSSSTGKYHSEDETGLHGNWLHTKRVFITYLTMSRSFLEQGLITEREREAGKSAALLHAMLKYGWPSENNEHTVNNHDVIGAGVAAQFGDLPKEVVRTIHAHNGSWGEGRNPTTAYEQVFHLSDYVASKPILGDVDVWRPAEELTELFPDLKTIDDEEFENLL